MDTKMAFYNVEIFYRTKRNGTACGMMVEAFGPDEAEEIARDHVLKGYPARQWVGSNITEVTPERAKSQGCINA